MSYFYFRNPNSISSALASSTLDVVLDTPPLEARQDYAYWWQLIKRYKAESGWA